MPYSPTFQRPSMRQWNNANPWAPQYSQQVYNPWRTPLEEQMLNQPLSDDQYGILLNKQVSDKLRKTRALAEVQKAQDESNFLDSIQPNDTAGIFSAPGDPRQARLQALLNRDYNARELGSKLSMAGEAYKAKMSWETQKRQMELLDQKRKYDQSKFENALDTKKYGQAERRLGFERDDETAKRKFQQQGYNLQRDQFDRRLRQDENNLTFNQNRDTRAQKYLERNSFLDVVNAMKTGSVDPAEVLSSADDWTPQQRTIIEGYGARRGQDLEAAQKLADQYNLFLDQATPQPVTPTDRRTFQWLGDRIGSNFGLNPFDPKPQPSLPTPEEVRANQDRVLEAYRKDQRAQKNILLDAETGSFVPIPRYQTPMPRASAAGGGFSDAITTGRTMNDLQSGPLLDQDWFNNQTLGPTNIYNSAGQLTQRFPPQPGYDPNYGMPAVAPTIPQQSQPAGQSAMVKTVPQNYRAKYTEGKEYPARDGSVWRYSNGQMMRIR